MYYQLSPTEQNYIKQIYTLSDGNHQNVLTSDLAAAIKIKAATATDMLSRLSDKKLVDYEKYYGARLTDKGKQVALNIIRKHRLWEVFLSVKLGFSWDEVHEMAEELEHATNDELSNRLEQFLGNPKTDPHGDPIPNRKGEIEKQKTIRLSETGQDDTVEIRSVEDQNPALLKFLSKHKLTPGARLLVKEINQYDSSLEVKVNNKKVLQLSRDVAENLWIIRVK